MSNQTSIRTSPAGKAIMYQLWDKLLFMHWPVSEELIRPHIPERLKIDMHGGSAWIGITPFTMKLWPAATPALAGKFGFHEINVRTYVSCDGVPGIWFFSLDSSSTLAVVGARLTYFLPYYRAYISHETRGEFNRFVAIRKHPFAVPAEFKVVWQKKDALPKPEPDSLEFFLVERYCLYATRGKSLYRAEIFHRPWSLCEVGLTAFSSTLLESHGLRVSDGNPLLHGQAEFFTVGIRRLQKI